MAKVIQMSFKAEATTITAFLEESKGITSDNKGISIMLAIKCEDGTVMTGYFNCDFGTKQEMVGHVQCDIIDQMILANLGDRY